MRAWLAKRKLWCSAIACGLVLRAVFAWFHPAFDGDIAIYGDLAQNMLHHHTYGLTEGAVIRSTLIRLPGYPLFLAACFAVFGNLKFLPVLVIQIALGLCGCWLLGLLAEERFGLRAGTVTIWLACVCPYTAEFDALPLTESLSLLCVVCAQFGLSRWLRGAEWKWAALVGAASAFGVLLRPDEGLLAAAMIPAMLFASRRRLAGAALASLLVVLPLGVWTARNLRTMHSFQPLAPKYANDPGEFVSHGFYLWYRTWAIDYRSTVRTYWLWDGAAITMSDLPARAIDGPSQLAETAKAFAAYNANTAATPTVDAMFGRLGEERARMHPVQTFALLPMARMLNMWLRPRTEFFKLPLAWWKFREHPGKSATAMLWAIPGWMLLGAALAGLRRWRWNAWGWAAVAFVLMRCALLMTIDNSEPRYTLVCFPVVLLLAASCAGAISAERSSCSYPS